MMKREDYKAVKHMDKAQMEAYLQRIYQRGYQAGIKAMELSLSEEAKKPQSPHTEPEATAVQPKDV